jgi:hydrogenase-1 operon protein HyaF
LLTRLCDEFGFRTLDPADVDALADGSGHVLLVFIEDPERYRETLDLAVIVPELARAYSGRFAVAVLLPEAARAIAPRYGFRRWPAVVLLRDGGYVGAIDGVRDWSEYRLELAHLLEAPTSRAPTIGIAVKAAGQADAPLPLGACMKTLNIPFRAIGPGSQPDHGAELQFMDMPKEIHRFSMPHVPENAAGRDMAMARAIVEDAIGALGRWRPGELAYPRIEVTDLASGPLALLNEVLGEGEVSIRVAQPRALRMQETLFAGVWRVLQFDEGGGLERDTIEICAIPRLAIESARRATRLTLPAATPPAGVMNAPSLLAEIEYQSHAWRDGAPAHVLNLSLLPLSPDDHRHLENALPVGPVAIMSRGFGNCRITSTALAHVWRVQYFNNMQTLILNTIEVVDVPEVALAAPEDLADSAERLAELAEWMAESCDV